MRKLGRAETAALVVETLACHDIDVVLLGGSCVCVWTDERFGSFDLDFIDLTYKRRREITAALAGIGIAPKGASRYFEHAESEWSVEFPTAPLICVTAEWPSGKRLTGRSRAVAVSD